MRNIAEIKEFTSNKSNERRNHIPVLREMEELFIHHSSEKIKCEGSKIRSETIDCTAELISFIAEQNKKITTLIIVSVVMTILSAVAITLILF